MKDELYSSELLSALEFCLYLSANLHQSFFLKFSSCKNVIKSMIKVNIVTSPWNFTFKSLYIMRSRLLTVLKSTDLTNRIMFWTYSLNSRWFCASFMKYLLFKITVMTIIENFWKRRFKASIHSSTSLS